MKDRIELTHKINNDGTIVIVDQHGRELRGVRSLTISAGVDRATELSIDCYAYNEAGSTHTNVKKSGNTPPLWRLTNENGLTLCYSTSMLKKGSPVHNAYLRDANGFIPKKRYPAVWPNSYTCYQVMPQDYPNWWPN